MLKPNNYDATKEYGSYETLPAGNYIGKVVMVEEAISKTNKEMLKIYLDIAEGEYAGFFQELYRDDTREEKKWPCIVNQLTQDKNGNCNRGLKTFISAVAASNPGFDPNAVWGDNFCNCFRDKRVGVSFREEEWINQNNEKRTSVKAYRFFAADAIEEQEMPLPKLLPESAPSYFAAPTSYAPASGFANLGDNEKLPWD